MFPTTSCPRCGHSYKNIHVEKSGGHAIMDTPSLWVQQEGDMAVILEEVRRLEGLIHQINEDRARLLRRVNSMQAATRRLPPELLSTIFQFARPSINFDTRSTPVYLPEDDQLRRNTYREEDDFQIVLGAVSSHWRQIAWATPQLWTTISVEVYETAGENNGSLLSLYFENSQSLPLTVELDFRAQLALLLDSLEDPPDCVMPIESIKTLFLNNAAKIQNFIVTGLPPCWISLINKAFSRCVSMTLYWPPPYGTQGEQNDTRPLDLSELPSLRHLRLKNFTLPFILPCQTITTLQLHGMTVRQCVESLINCTNLIKFENLGFGRRSPLDPLPSLTQSVVLENLESLTWCIHEDSWSSTFFSYIRFPKLCVLKLSANLSESPSESLYNDIATFFSGLESLRVLELDSIFLGYRFMKTALASTPHLTELILNTCSFTMRSMAISMIGRPVDGLVEDTAEKRAVVGSDQLDGAKMLPRLRKLIILVTYGLQKSEMIVEMLEALRGARVAQEHFSLELSQLECDWRLEYLEKLKQLAESGFEFEILMESRPLDYMSPLVGVSGGPG